MGKKLDDKDKNHFQNLADELKPREQMARIVRSVFRFQPPRAWSIKCLSMREKYSSTP